MEISHADKRHIARARKAGNRKTRWTDEQILDAIRQADREGVHTSPAYQKWCSGPGRPSFRTLTARYGTWKNARLKAGFRPTPGEDFSWKTTDAEHLDAVVRCAQEMGKLPSLSEYRTFREEREGEAPEWPSDALIRTALGGWGRALELVRRELERRR